MDPAIVTVEEVRSVRDSLGVRRTQRTLGPMGWSQAPAMLSQFSDQMNSELHLVLNTRRSRGHQSPTPNQFLCTHNIFDAKLGRRDSAAYFSPTAVTSKPNAQPGSAKLASATLSRDRFVEDEIEERFLSARLMIDSRLAIR